MNSRTDEEQKEDVKVKGKIGITEHCTASDFIRSSLNLELESGTKTSVFERFLLICHLLIKIVCYDIMEGKKMKPCPLLGDSEIKWLLLYCGIKKLLCINQLCILLSLFWQSQHVVCIESPPQFPSEDDNRVWGNKKTGCSLCSGGQWPGPAVCSP